MMLSILKTIFGFLSPLIEKLFGRDTEKALELKAQKELEELRAFSTGRIPPRYMLLYALVGIFSVFSLLVICSLFFPSLFNSPEISKIRDILEMGTTLVP